MSANHEHKRHLEAGEWAEKFRFLSVGVLCTVEQKTELEKQIKRIFLRKAKRNDKQNKENKEKSYLVGNLL